MARRSKGGRERERERELLLTAIASQHRNSGVVAQGGVSRVLEALQAKASDLSEIGLKGLKPDL